MDLSVRVLSSLWCGPGQCPHLSARLQGEVSQLWTADLDGADGVDKEMLVGGS